MEWTFVYLMVGLKLPIALLLYIVWWAIHATEEPAASGNDDGGGTKVRHPRDPLPRPPRRGPHAEPAPPPPARVRSAVSRTRAADR